MADEIIPAAEHSAAMIVDSIHKIAEEHEPLPPSVGVVLTPPPNLTVQWNDIVISTDKIYLNEYWLPGHTRTHKGHIVSATQDKAGGGGYAEFASHNHDINNPYTDTETLTDTLKPGDFVSVYPQKGGQLFIIESKLVKL